MAPPSLIDFILSRNLADGVAVAGCAESACYNRLGVAWTEQRFAGERDPYLRARVPRERLRTIWTSALETRTFETKLAEFTAEVAALPPPKPRGAAASPRPAAPPSIPTVTGDAVENRSTPL